MSTFIERLRDEKRELSEKIVKLEQFIQSEKFNIINDKQQLLLKIQLYAMSIYKTCLIKRLRDLKGSREDNR